MYKIYLWLCIAASASYLAVFSSCTQDYLPVTINGEIRNAIENQPIEGLFFSIETNRCGLTGLTNCDLVHQEDQSDENGKFRLYFSQDCSNEFHVSIPSELKDTYPKYDLIITEKSERYLPISCQNKVIIYPEQNYNLDILLQPQMTLFMWPQNSTLGDVDKILVPEFGVEINELIAAGTSKTLNITKVKGAIDVEIYYTDGSLIVKNLSYNYLIDQVINLEILN